MNHGRIALLGGDLAAIYPSPLESQDGPDLVRFCVVHQWASLPTVPRRIPEICPQCAIETDPRGRQRYRDLQRRLVAEIDATPLLSERSHP